MKTYINSFFLTLVILTLACQGNVHNSQVVIVDDASEVMQILKSKNVQLIDVRTDAEYVLGHITGARLINIKDPKFLPDMEKLDKDAPVLIYCAVGGRSTEAVNKISEMGFKEVYNYKGGMRDWRANGMVEVR